MTITDAQWINAEQDGVHLTFDNGKSVTIPTFKSSYEHTELFNEFVANGGVIKPQFTDTEIFKQKVSHFESLARDHIQSLVTAHNDANMTTFADVYRCEKYKDSPTHPSAQFCTDVWAYNDLVWSTLRLLLIDVLDPDTATVMPADDAEFLAALPEYTGV